MPCLTAGPLQPYLPGGRGLIDVLTQKVPGSNPRTVDLLTGEHEGYLTRGVLRWECLEKRFTSHIHTHVATTILA